jgi:hypothetical protein
MLTVLGERRIAPQDVVPARENGPDIAGAIGDFQEATPGNRAGQHFSFLFLLKC